MIIVSTTRIPVRREILLDGRFVCSRLRRTPRNADGRGNLCTAAAFLAAKSFCTRAGSVRAVIRIASRGVAGADSSE